MQTNDLIKSLHRSYIYQNIFTFEINSYKGSVLLRRVWRLKVIIAFCERKIKKIFFINFVFAFFPLNRIFIFSFAKRF